MARKKIFDYDLDDTASFDELERDVFGESDSAKKNGLRGNSRSIPRK